MGDVKRFGNDVGHRHARVERGVRVLEDERHLLARLGQLGAGEGREVLPVEGDLAARGLGKAKHALAGGGLAAARLAHDGKRLAATYLEAHVLERMHVVLGLAKEALLDGITLGQVFRLEDDLAQLLLLGHY